MPSKTKRATRHGMFIYCEKEQSSRIKAMAARAGKSLSQYVLDAIMPTVEADEKKYSKKG